MGEKGFKKKKKNWQREWKSFSNWCGFIRHLLLHLRSYMQKADWVITTCSCHFNSFGQFYHEGDKWENIGGNDLTVVRCLIYLGKQRRQYASTTAWKWPPPTLFWQCDRVGRRWERGQGLNFSLKFFFHSLPNYFSHVLHVQISVTPWMRRDFY